MAKANNVTQRENNVASGSRLEYQRRVFDILSDKWVMGVLTIVPATLLFIFVNVIPIGWAVAAGFFEISAFSPVWHWAGLSNYQQILTNSEFWATIRRSLVFAGGSVAIQLVVGTGFALLLNRTFRGSTFVRAIMMLPYLIPTAILGFIALWMGNSQFGIINQVLVSLGLITEKFPWYGNESTAMIAVIITNSWKFSIFVTIMVLARLQSIPSGLYEAAEVMGATPYERFRDVTLPNLKGVIFIVFLLRGIWMFNKFDIIYVLTQGGPRGITTTAPIYAYKVAFNQLQLGYAAAISTLLFVMLIAGAIIYFHVLEPEQEVRVE
ncbi:carbohydrate ABC transporter permease [Halopelagius fulvigenes]|uniref:Carbohydrate ABC transporter permease n=1 Tax=Halopelagius fulvigenes TaxID=1198324 RepID=A0ABD5TY09_9EURY